MAVVLIGAGRRLVIEDGASVVIGRRAPADLEIPDRTLGRRHARIFFLGAIAVIEDAGSPSGTFVNERRVLAPVPITSGDRIRLGGVLLDVE